jgi:hypothetical protein
MPDPGQDDAGHDGSRGGAPCGGRAQRILRTVQDQGWHAELGQSTTVLFRAY